MTQAKNDRPLDTEVLTALLEAIPPEAPPLSLRERVLNQARGQSPVQMRGLTTIRAADSDWKTLIPGIDFKILVYDEAAGSKSFLLRAAAGTRMPPHRHHAYEECLVLEGEFSFGELTLQAGDFHGAAPDAEHCEAYTRTGVTVYLRASIEDYPGIAP